MRSDLDRLSDILEAIQVWVIHHLQVIGKAARGVSQLVRDGHPEVQWPQIVALRNILVHEYFDLNLDQIWMMTQKDLPKLEEQVRPIRAETVVNRAIRIIQPFGLYHWPPCPTPHPPLRVLFAGLGICSP